MKSYYWSFLILFCLCSGCEGINDASTGIAGKATSTPVTYVYNADHPGLADINQQDQFRLKSENQEALMRIIEAIKVDKGRRPEAVDELYVYDDELDLFKKELQLLTDTYKDNPMRPLYEQQIALIVVDQWLTLPEGDVYSEDRLALVSELTERLLRWKSNDVRVLANALILLKDTWGAQNLLEGVEYVEVTAATLNAEGNAAALSNPALPLHIRTAQVNQQQKTEAVLGELAALKRSLAEGE